MTILSLETISKQYGPRALFQDFTLGMVKGERLGIIGANGCGKTTLLRIIAGLEAPDTGRVTWAQGLRVAYLPQEPVLPAEGSVLAAVFAGDAPTMRLLRAYESLSGALALAPDDQDVLAQLNALTPQMDALGAWDAETAAHSIITELGLAAQMHAPVATLSGGQRKRVAMARMLIERPDLLILDEPTNHIDTTTIAWLEEYLARTTTALILVTHDRYFLERLVGRMLEVDRGQVTSYQGNYGRFLEQKAERLQHEAASEAARQNLLRRELAWLRRGARGRTTKQKAHVERVHDLMAQRPTAAQGTVSIDLAQGRRLGKRVLQLKALSKHYDGQTLINQFDLEVHPGDRVGIIGPNGSGKTTLLNIITGRVVPDAGEVIVGTTVHMAYYDQEAMGLNETQRVVDYIRDAAEQIRGREGALVAATSMLERFLFTSEQQWALISTLSGGERRRLYLLRQLIEAPNLLILDEPTNDLDLQTLGVLEDYLDEFNGAVITVSHDRYFLDRVVQRTLAFAGEGRIVEYPGGYSSYAERQAAAAKAAPRPPTRERKTTPSSPQPSGAPNRSLGYKERRELQELEAQIPQLEAQRDQLAAALSASGSDYQQVSRLSAELAQYEERIETAFLRWAELSERV
ncbi:MAG: ABC transporter ATP-binding protein [Candidatus Viridilinea halotolerans]|uniref:ABC transporter ATP-binding protein n=1 Tax=Candidatus Viridilinea halotolerans TaxID=2491704 RepID=A0A426TTL3_9CHLR|nr:MAG: ABC transporter ATP-binding protein [Candidatus Viridilinea halotolerans]